MGFDLGAMLRDVSKLDTEREQITYLPLSSLDGDENNFYGLRDIDTLADNISVAGLQQPIRVRQNEAGRYTIVSGHRRRAAVALLAESDPEAWKEVPCIVERDAASPALQELRLIYANANTRTLTAAELSRQAEEVEKLLYALSKEGYEFPGRMRNYVAEAVGVSQSKLARLKVIRDSLSEDWKKLFEADRLSENQAYALAKMSPATQNQIFTGKTTDKARCNISAYGMEQLAKRYAETAQRVCPKNGSPCENRDNINLKITRTDSWQADFICHSCCEDCPQLPGCSLSCRLCSDKKAEMRAATAEAAKSKAEAAAKTQSDVSENIRSAWLRLGEALEHAGITLEELADKTTHRYWYSPMGLSLAHLKGEKITGLTPYPICMDSNGATLVATADLLGVTTDYLLGREENVSKLDTGWNTGHPKAPGQYVVYYCLDSNCSDVDILHWSGSSWWLGKFECNKNDCIHVLCWSEVPKVPRQQVEEDKKND